MAESIALAGAMVHLSALATEAEAGGAFIVTRHGRRVAKTVIASTDIVRAPGGWGWYAPCDKSVFARMMDEDMREER